MLLSILIMLQASAYDRQEYYSLLDSKNLTESDYRSDEIFACGKAVEIIYNIRYEGASVNMKEIHDATKRVSDGFSKYLSKLDNYKCETSSDVILVDLFSVSQKSLLELVRSLQGGENSPDTLGGFYIRNGHPPYEVSYKDKPISPIGAIHVLDFNLEHNADVKGYEDFVWGSNFSHELGHMVSSAYNLTQYTKLREEIFVIKKVDDPYLGPTQFTRSPSD